MDEFLRLSFCPGITRHTRKSLSNCSRSPFLVGPNGKSLVRRCRGPNAVFLLPTGKMLSMINTWHTRGKCATAANNSQTHRHARTLTATHSRRDPMNCQTHLYLGQDPKLVTRRWFFRQCGVGLGASPWTSCCARPASPRPRRTAIRWPSSSRITRRRPSASSSCSWPARPAISSCSITSRSWPSTTARCRPRTCSRAIAPPSSIPTPSCWDRSSSSPNTANAARNCPNCCRTWPPSPMTSPSSNRW